MESTVISPEAKRKLRFAVAASSVGTLIEWYDFYIFGSLAVILSAQFFPAHHPTAAFLSTLAMLAAGIIVRPFGALVFGRLGDLTGRKPALLRALVLMGGATVAIGLIPGFESIGILAPILVLIMRLLQGLASGGEYGGAATYVAEHAPPAQRGFYTSFIQTSATLSLIFSIGVMLAVRKLVGADDFSAWGWRIPFIFSAVLSGASMYIRLNMEESPVFTEIKSQGTLSKNPLTEIFGKAENLKFIVLALFGVVVGQGVVLYTGQVYAMTFIEKICQVESNQTRNIMAISWLIGTPLFIYFGALSDKIGRKMIMMIGMLMAVILYQPIYGKMYELADNSKKKELTDRKAVTTSTSVNEKDVPVTLVKTERFFVDGNSESQVLITTKGLAKPAVLETRKEVILSNQNYWAMIMYVLVQVVLVTMVCGPMAAFLADLFPARIRYTAMSLPYHIGNGVFGGLTLYMATALHEASKTENNPSGDPFAGLFYPIIVAVICFIIGMIFLSNKKQESIVDQE